MFNFLLHRMWILEHNSKIFNNYFRKFNLIYVSNHLSLIICKKDINVTNNARYIYIFSFSFWYLAKRELGPIGSPLSLALDFLDYWLRSHFKVYVVEHGYLDPYVFQGSCIIPCALLDLVWLLDAQILPIHGFSVAFVSRLYIV